MTFYCHGVIKLINIVQNNSNRYKYIQMNVDERLKNSKVLKRGDILLISKKSGVSVTVVYRYINGLLKDSAAAPYFEALVEKRKMEIENISFD